ncbi:MAG TPA: hypothetical protein VFB16_01030 [Bauldia sp.]|nr:hypothetical protein [Bauldia sp.]
MPSNPRTTAETRFRKAQDRAREAATAMNEVVAEARRLDANTARLKALRLAKEAKDAVEAAAEKAAKAAAKAAPRVRKPRAAPKPKASLQVEELNASNDE